MNKKNHTHNNLICKHPLGNLMTMPTYLWVVRIQWTELGIAPVQSSPCELQGWVPGLSWSCLSPLSVLHLPPPNAALVLFSCLPVWLVYTSTRHWQQLMCWLSSRAQWILRAEWWGYESWRWSTTAHFPRPTHPEKGSYLIRQILESVFRLELQQVLPSASALMSPTHSRVTIFIWMILPPHPHPNKAGHTVKLHPQSCGFNSHPLIGKISKSLFLTLPSQEFSFSPSSGWERRGSEMPTFDLFIPPHPDQLS